MRKLKKLKNACAPMALHHVSGIDHETVLRVCASCGFDVNEGMSDEEWQEAAQELLIEITRCHTGKINLGSFVKKFPIGLYLVTTFDHILCVDNGLVYDPREMIKGRYPGLGRSVKGAWRVEK
jgi:hypothetical protein